MVSISAVIVHADIGTPAHQLERIGARLNMMATEGAGRGVLIVPASLIDTAFGAAGHSDVQILCQPGPAEVIAAVAMACTTRTRSDEHTSELQSLIRISYAVFCLKKKK